MALPKNYFLRKGFNYATGFSEKRNDTSDTPRKKYCTDINSQPEAMDVKCEEDLSMIDQYTIGFEPY